MLQIITSKYVCLAQTEKNYIRNLVLALKIKNSFLVEGYHAKVNLRGVDSLVYSGRLGLIVVDLCYFALFGDFSP